ncbi:hypothetical protein [Pseudomonas sp. NPDC090201]|uniref:hypothetical protein n=1 Tax=Pseudomonas sp. NPDC090201 TaxID=3364475 RepID=UPI003812995C
MKSKSFTDRLMEGVPVVLVLLGVAVAVFGICQANALLATKALTGTEFVWLTATYIATGLFVAVLPKVTELSIWSLSVKIAQAKKEAEVTLKQLEEVLELSFLPAIASIADSPGTPVNSPYDPRFAKFFVLVDAIDKAGLRNRFAPELTAAARTIAAGQLWRVGNLNHAIMGLTAKPDVLPTPTAVNAELLKSGIARDHAWYMPPIDEAVAIQASIDALGAYAKIYEHTL